MTRQFRIHASDCHKIMGRIGLTDNQLENLQALHLRRSDPSAKALTANMVAEYNRLSEQHANPCLSETCTTFLKEYYAGDNEQFYSKETQKGNLMEEDCIDFMARVLGYGLASKNTITYSDEYCIGTPDVNLPDAVADTKCPWNRKTFLDNIKCIDPKYDWQLRVYCRLLDKRRGILFYGLMDTPELDYTPEVTYSHLPDNERWLAYYVERDLAIEQSIVDRVILCRKWLSEYHKSVMGRLGRIV